MKYLLTSLTSFWLGGAAFIVSEWDAMSIYMTDERFWIIVKWPYLVARYWIGI